MTVRTAVGRALRRLAVRAEGGDKPNWSMTIGSLEDKLRGGYGRTSKIGKLTSVEAALQVTDVFAVILRIAFGVAQVPWKIFKARADGRGNDEDRDHSLWLLLHLKPNEWQTSWDFRITMMFHLLLTFNFFCYVSRSQGEIVELIPLLPGRMTVKRGRDQSLRYFYSGAEDGATKEIPRADIWHVRGPSWNGWFGLDAVRLAREAIGLSMVAEDTHGEVLKRGLKIPGVLAMEGEVGKEDYADLAKWVREQAQKDIEETGVMLVDRTAKFTSVTMTAQEGQVQEARSHQLAEICRHWGMFPVMVGHPPDMAAKAAMEQMFIAHVVHTLDPWYVCVEMSAAAFLLKAEELKTHTIRFIRAGMMRGDLKSQGEFFAKMVGQGATGPGQAVFTPNDVRALLEMNPVDGGDALSQGPVPGAPPPAKPKPEDEPEPEDPDDDPEADPNKRASP